MGATSSVKLQSVTQEHLDEAVAAVVSHTYDRVIVRAHYAKVMSGKEVDAKISFEVAADAGASEILPRFPAEPSSPPNAASFFAATSDSPTWNQEELLLFLRNRDDGTAPDQNVAISGRVLRVKLENVKDLKGKIADHITAAAESTQRFLLRNIERFMTDMDHKASPFVDTAAEDIDDEMPSSIENLEDEHTIPLPAPADGWVHHELEGDRATVFISLRTSYAEDKISSKANIEQVQSRMVELVLKNLTHGNKALLRHLQVPANTRAILYVPGFNDSFHNHVFAESLLNAGYDVWILDLRRSGACRKAFPGSTAPLEYHQTTRLREYFEEIEKTVELMKSRQQPYKDIVAYSHSTSALITLDFALEFTDTQFSGFIFNSPFLDWGVAGGQLISHSKFLPKKVANLALNTQQLRKHSLYDFDTDTQALYLLQISDEWVETCERMQKIIHERPYNCPITRRPFLILTSRKEKCVSNRQLLDYSKRIGPTGTVVQMSFTSHDCISSREPEKVYEAISYVLAWLKGNIDTFIIP